MFSSRRAVVKLHAVAVVAIIVIAVICGAYYYQISTPSTRTSPKLKVGYALELTGASATSGQAILQGLNTWLNITNSQGGIYVPQLQRKIPVEVIGFDTQTNPTIAAVDAQKLISENVNVVMPVAQAATALAIIPVLSKAGIPIMLAAMPQATLQQFASELYRTVIPTWGPYASQQLPFFQYLASENTFPKPKSMAMFYSDTAFCQEFIGNVTSTAQSTGIQTVWKQAYASGQASYVNTLTNAQGANPDLFLICSGYAPDSVNIIRNMNSISFKPKLVFLNQIGTAGVASSLGSLAEGLMGVSFWNPDVKTPGESDFMNMFVKLYPGVAPTYLSAVAYAAMQIYVAAVQKAGTIDNAMVSRAMGTLQNVETVGGMWNSGSTISYVIVQVISGTLSTIYPTDLATKSGILTNK